MVERIAVLMTVHNRCESTLNCLQRVFSQIYDSERYHIEIFMTDDGCTYETRQSVITRFPSVHIIDGNGTLFWNRGMYAAWKEAEKGQFDFYLWLNDDTLIYDNTINRLLASSTKHSNKSIIVGSTSKVGDPSTITYGGWVNRKLIKDVSLEQRCQTINGNIVLVPRFVYEVLGTNDPYYRHAVGDTDYGLRAQEKGIDIWVAQGVLGECNLHDRPTIWMDPSQPFLKRWNNFFSPLGNNPIEFFHFRKRHYGFFPACLTLVSNFVHFFFPKLWISKYSKQ